MMSCNIIIDLLPLYIDDVCSEDSRRMVEEHLKECEDCRREAEMMKKEITVSDMDIIQSEMSLLQEGRKSIEAEAREGFLSRAIGLDLALNIVIVLASICGMIYQNMPDENILWIVLFYFLNFPFGLILFFSITDIAYFIFRHLQMETFMTENVAYTSMSTKGMLLLVGVVFVVFSDFSRVLEMLEMVLNWKAFY